MVIILEVVTVILEETEEVLKIIVGSRIEKYCRFSIHLVEIEIGIPPPYPFKTAVYKGK